MQLYYGWTFPHKAMQRFIVSTFLMGAEVVLQQTI